MEFKIDTKEAFSTVRPVTSALNAKLTGELNRKCEELRQSGSKNLIIDLGECTEIDSESVKIMIAMHEDSYSHDHSLVFTEPNAAVMAIIKEEEADMAMNVAPRMIEAIDIVSMEILERDLLSEEE